MKPPPETMNVEREAETLLRANLSESQRKDRLIALLDRQRVLALREAADHCEGQIFPWEAAKGDPYREGQFRGAHDCMTVVTRLADCLEGKWPPPRPS